jgi:RimJ/RimL family protein N-acetyltransferase
MGVTDLPWFVTLRNSVRHFLHDPSEFSIAEAEDWYHESKPDFRVISQDNQQVGYFRLSTDEQNPVCLWVGADIDPKYQGHGIAREAYEKFLPEFTREFECSEFRLRVLPANVRAIGLYLSLGFRTSSVETAVSPDGRSVLVIDYTMTRLAEPKTPNEVGDDLIEVISKTLPVTRN